METGLLNTNDVDGEEAVRRYLVYLEDPETLLDRAEIEVKQKAVDNADDPIAKLHALADLDRVTRVDEKAICAAFVEHAKHWADANRIPDKAFLSLKHCPPDQVLRSAGFELPGGRERKQRRRAKARTVEEIKTHVLERTGPFTTFAIANDFGGAPRTIATAVRSLLDEHRIEELGPLAGVKRGRAPMQYQVCKP